MFKTIGFRLIYNNAEELLWPMAEPVVRRSLKYFKERLLQWYNEEFPDQAPETTVNMHILSSNLSYAAHANRRTTYSQAVALSTVFRNRSRRFE